MPVSHKHKCVFVHIPRTGGTSFRELFREDKDWYNDERMNREDLLFVQSSDASSPSNTEPRILHKQHLFLHHMHQLHLLEDEPLVNYYKFAFVRNPWDKALSAYANHYKQYCLDFADYVNKVKVIVDFINEHFTYDIEADFYTHYSRITFNTLNEKELNFPYTPWGNNVSIADPFFWPQYLYTHNLEGTFVLDGVGRFENYEHDANKILQKLGIEAGIPKANASTHRPYQEMYTSTTRDIIANIYALDIGQFGYEF